jgi:hypothetical protein
MGGRKRAGLAVNDPANLVRVCLGCHSWIEANPSEADALGLLHPDGPDAPVWLHPVYGPGWYRLTGDGCYEFVDRPAPAEIGVAWE